MAITSWPYVAQDTTDIEYSRLFREMAGDGVVDSLGGTGLRVTGDSSGMQVKMAAGSAIARGYMMYSTAVEIVPVTTAHASLQRVDRCVLELNLSAPTVPQRLVPKMLAGTPAAVGSATPPAMTQTDTGIYQISMGLVTVDPGVGTIAAGKVADDRDFLDQRVGQWVNNNKRPTAPRKYKLGFNEQLGGFEYWDGTTWKALGDHTHSLTSSQITGILPLSKGGLGADTKAGARATLGFTVATSAPSSPAVDDLWVKKSS